MKKIVSLAITVTLLIGVSPHRAQADEDLLRLAISLCDFAKADDRTSMRRKLKAAGMKLRAIYPAIRCGGSGSLLRVATENNALEAAKFLASKVSDDAFNTPEEDGKTLIQWAEGLVAAGDASKQPFVDLFKEKSN
jgi:ankyrin repeat protein